MAPRPFVEPIALRAELLRTVFGTGVPLAIMATLFVVTGLYATIATRDPVTACLTVGGTCFMIGKGLLHIAYRRAGQGAADAQRVADWTRWFGIGNIAFAAALGALTGRMFIVADPMVQLIGIGLLFGFCSGQVARVAFLPQIATASIIVTVLPVVIVLLAGGDLTRMGLAVMMLLFTAGSIESVRTSYLQARERIAMLIDMEGMATADPLTGLCNRFGLRRAIEDRLHARGGSTLVAVHCFDLDGFKSVNDLHGHRNGDALLIEVARRVREVMRQDDIAARTGGDEFVVVQDVTLHGDEAEIFARRLNRAIVARYDLNGIAATVGMSIGSCVGMLGADDLAEMLALADERMYIAKRAGGGVGGTTRAGAAIRGI